MQNKNKKILKNLLIFLLCLLPNFVLAKNFNFEGQHATIDLKHEFYQIAPGETSQILIKVDLAEGWHSYWENPGDTGFPISLSSATDNVTIGEQRSEVPQIIKYQEFVNYGYEDVFYLLYELKYADDLKPQKLDVNLDLTYLVCNRVCIPETVELNFQIDVTKHSQINYAYANYLREAIDSFAAPVKSTDFNIANGNFILDLSQFDISGNDIYFFARTENLLEYSSQQEVIRDLKYLVVKADDSTDFNQISGILKIGDNYYDLNAERNLILQLPINNTASNNLLSIILYAILGGIILNFMPCVFPVLSLKCLHIANMRMKDHGEIKKSAWFYFFGIEISFIVLAIIVILLKQAGLAIGWGFHLQSPFFISFLIILFFLIALNLSDIFTLDNFYLSNVNFKSQSELANSFFSGALMTIVATPCTAPFMAAAIGFAFTQSNFMIYIIFLALGLGLSLPVILISMNKMFLRLIPRPGKWLVSFKQFLAFPFYFTAIWLLWVFHNLTDADLLFLFLVSLVAITMLIWLTKQFRSLILKLVMFIAAIVIIIKFLGLVDDNFSKLSTDLNSTRYEYMEEFSIENVKNLIKQNKKVFVNVTADWCLTCKYNKITSFGTNDIVKLFNDNEIYYIEADWTNYNSEITQFLNDYNRSGVPLYLFIKEGDVKILPQVLTKSYVEDTVID